MGLEDLLSGRLSGSPLKAVASALRHPAAAALGANMLRRDLGIDRLPALIEDGEVLEPSVTPRTGRPPREFEASLEEPKSPAWTMTAQAFTEAFKAGENPEHVLDAIFREADRLAHEKPWLACLWTRDERGAREAARASANRYRKGEPLGPLDGVPVVVKEQIAVRGLPHRLGNALPGSDPAKQDATLVTRLRNAGALIVGQTAMTEIGMSPIGINPQRPGLRNPHHAERATGGSSGGAGVAAAMGLCALSVGADGGGSIRIPAAMCGVFGLKPTFGRVPRTGDAFSGSLNHDGPLAASTRDLALFLDATHGPCPKDPTSLAAPPSAGRYQDAIKRNVVGLKLGIDEHELRDADPAIAKACRQAIAALEASGAVLVDVNVPLMRHAAGIGALTIAAETQATMAYAFAQHRDAFSPDLQAFMEITTTLTAKEYLQAQALRERLRRQMASAFSEIDALILPTTAKSALEVSAADERTGRLDGRGVHAMCRFAFLGNVTGLPAGTAPVGLDPDGLPIGVQIVGDAWDEATVLTVLAQLERAGAARPPLSPHHVGEALLKVAR